MKHTFQKILYGGDYNPNQWPREIWAEDMKLFDKAGINSTTINVFSWAKLQPAEEVYDFTELDAMVDMLTKEGKQIVLATSTGALPAWMSKRYPEVMRTDYEGRHHKFSHRHNACPNSPVYQHYVKKLVEKLAERYGHHENVVCWHVNNEYGGECYCENCEKAFRVWLQRKYKTIEALNQAWNFEFWGHTVYDWDEIVLPNALGEGIGEDKTAFSGLSIDYRRFNSDSLLENFKLERDTIRQYDQTTPITTNLMGTYKGLDYFKWAKEMDIVSWDNYPSYTTPWSETAMNHDLMRGLKGAPFMLMEQTPSQQNWQPYNSLKKPGQMRAQSYQTLAHGADTIQFFQLRRSVGGCEKFHGAVIEHAGSDQARVFKEVSALGQELKKIGDLTLGSQNEAKVGILFDWDNYWALEYTSGPNRDLTYVEQILSYYRYFYDNNIAVDMLAADADFQNYDLVVAPVLYMIKDGMAEALEAYVAAGGTLVTGFMSGIVNQSDNVYLGGYPGPLRTMAGVWVEEIDALLPDQTNGIAFADGTQAEGRLLCDIIHPEGAEELAHYTGNFYAGTPAVTRNAFGQGYTYYVGTMLTAAAIDRVLHMACTAAGVKPVIAEATELEVVKRTADHGSIYFIMNFRTQDIALPEMFIGKEDMLSGKLLEKGDVLKTYDVRLVYI